MREIELTKNDYENYKDVLLNEMDIHLKDISGKNNLNFEKKEV